MKQVSKKESHLVWDRFVRFFHWSLVSCVFFNYFVMDDGRITHQWAGYFAVVMVLARIIWGFIGSPFARFSSFFPTPSRLANHVRQVRMGNHDASPGHNPIGALMMLFLMTTVLALGTTGWMQTLDAFWGDEWLQNLHRYIGNALIFMATLHATAAIVMGRIERTRLIKAMITGTKERW